MKRIVKSSHSAIIQPVKGNLKAQSAEEGTTMTLPDPIISARPPNNLYIDLENDGICYEVAEIIGDGDKV